MIRLTAAGTEAGESAVRRDLDRIVAAVRERIEARDLKAVVLIGGFARGEGGLLTPERGEPRAFNDYDLVVLTTRRLADPLAGAAEGLAREIGIDFVDFAILGPDEVRPGPTIFWYELLENHVVLYGPGDVFGGCPRIDPRDLPLVEATRLLTNRGLGLLWAWMILDEALPAAGALTREQLRFTVNAVHKTVLAAGEAALLRRGLYHVSYRERARRLAGADLPAPLNGDDFRRAHAAATRFKLFPEIGASDPGALASWWHAVRTWHEAAFRWIEEERLGRALKDWSDYPGLMLRETVVEALRHPRRYVQERALTPALRGWGARLLDRERSLRSRLPFLLYAAGPAGPDAGLLDSGLRGFPATGAGARPRWRELSRAILSEWHP